MCKCKERKNTARFTPSGQARIGGTVQTCSPYKCKESKDGNTMVCTRRCTTIKAGSGQAQGAASKCAWDCKEVNPELTICSKRCDIAAAPPPGIPPPPQYPVPG